MAKSGLDICKEFLKASQRGDLTSLEEFRLKFNIEDWTAYRHVVSGDTALHLATREGHYHVVVFLCEAWEKPVFKIEVANKDMKRPLHDAAQFARSHILRYLITRGASVDPLKRADWTPLMLACTKSGEEATKCVDALLNHGAIKSLRNKDGWTPLLLACRAGNLDVIEILIKHSLEETIYANSKNGRNCLHVAAFHGHVNVINLLLSNDKESRLINSKDLSGSTPLLESIKSGDLKTFKHLIESKADAKVVDDVGQNVLHLAAQSGNVDIIKYIIDNRLVDINSKTFLGITPLMLADKNKQHQAVEILNCQNNSQTS